ncbi:hypothetical protein KO465_00345 [Candidatus Micrarchaeota archaeon]|jgi:hypothetical protein|nr:hypothetical protein [Candidatus Micrarchaeota archaeon]
MKWNMIFGIFAVLCLAGAAFAINSEALKNSERAPKEAQIELMKAMHEGDFATAKQIHEEFGIGNRKMAGANQEIFDLRVQMKDAINKGNYELAYEIKQELREISGQRMPPASFKGLHDGPKRMGNMENCPNN